MIDRGCIVVIYRVGGISLANRISMITRGDNGGASSRAGGLSTSLCVLSQFPQIRVERKKSRNRLGKY